MLDNNHDIRLVGVGNDGSGFQSLAKFMGLDKLIEMWWIWIGWHETESHAFGIIYSITNVFPRGVRGILR